MTNILASLLLIIVIHITTHNRTLLLRGICYLTRVLLALLLGLLETPQAFVLNRTQTVSAYDCRNPKIVKSYDKAKYCDD